MKCSCCGSKTIGGIRIITADKKAVVYCEECHWELMVAVVSTLTREQLEPYEERVRMMRDEV